MSDIKSVRQVLQAADNVLVVTGAGVSAESGIPTFRGDGGYWRGHKAEELASPRGFQENPRLVWDWYLERRRLVAEAKPNEAHVALAEWSKRRSGTNLVTQNVDGLHARAGHEEVVEIHGSLWKNHCRSCGYRHTAEERHYPVLPSCPVCQNLLGPGVVWFGEKIGFDAIHRTNLAFCEARAILVVGTSGLVSPIADFLHRERRRFPQTPVIEVNPGESAVPSTLRLTGTAAELLPQILSP